MSEWTHNICRDCWTKREPDRAPVMVRDAPMELCCFCGGTTDWGIYVRADPKTMTCKHNNTEK